MDLLPALAIVVAALIALLVVISVLRRGRRTSERPFATSTEGETRCPRCGMGNIWTDATCASCGAELGG